MESDVYNEKIYTFFLEDLNHILRSCPRAHEVWELAKIDRDFNTPFNTLFMNNMTLDITYQNPAVPHNVMFIFISCNIWFRKNVWC